MKIRSYLPPELWSQETVHLAGAEAHHLIRVLRVAKGEELVCFDGEGHEARAVVSDITRHKISLALKEKKQTPLRAYQLTLAAAVPGNVKFDQIVDQATQLEVSRIIPVLTERTIVTIPEKGRVKKQSRWNKIARAAGKQSGVSRLPVVEPVCAWKDLMRVLPQYPVALIATTDGPYEKISSVLQQVDQGKIIILIGPEGDFTIPEIEQAVHAGAHRLSLGPSIMRCETAVVVAVGLVSSFLWEKSWR